MRWRALIVAVFATLHGCAARHAVTRADLSDHLQVRLGAGLPAEPTPQTLPDGVVLDDGLTMDEAVAIALWNDPDFAVRLTELGLARADLMTAGKFQNPVITGLIPLDPRQWQVALAVPLQGLWIRPAQVASARALDEAVGQRVVQAAVDLARDVRLAYLQTAAARARTAVLANIASLQEERQRRLQLRVYVGDVAPTTLDLALQEQLDAARGAEQAELEEDRTDAGLAERTGVAALASVPLQPLEALIPTEPLPPLEALVDRAAVSRPDLRAATLEVDAARTGVRAARAAAVSASMGFQVQGGGASNNGWGLTPGLAIPLFDRNQDGIARAHARVEAAEARLYAQRIRLETEVRVARAELEDAVASWSRLRDEALPARRAAVERLELAHSVGDISGVEALDARLALARTELARIDAEAAVIASRVRLERTLGGPPDGNPVVAPESLHARNP